MANQLNAEEIRRLLKLEPNATCGYVRETYLSKMSIAPGGLPAPFADGRPLGSALYFMPGAGGTYLPMVLNSWPTKPSGVQLARPILPPRRQTRASSFAACC